MAGKLVGQRPRKKDMSCHHGKAFSPTLSTSPMLKTDSEYHGTNIGSFNPARIDTTNQRRHLVHAVVKVLVYGR